MDHYSNNIDSINR